MNRKLEAFTILELLVVIVISSLLLTIATRVFFQFSGYHQRIGSISGKSVLEYELEYFLKRDFQRYPIVTSQHDELVLSNDFGDVLYHFRSDSVYRFKNPGPSLLELSVGSDFQSQEQKVYIGHRRIPVVLNRRFDAYTLMKK